MGFFSAMAKMFSGTDTLHDDWMVLNDVNQVQDIMDASNNRPQIIYKHSHRCSICIMAKERLEESIDSLSKEADLNFVNVVKSRPVSNAINERTGIRHESPQVLIIQNEEVIWHDSHHSIDAEAVLGAL